MKHFRLGNRSFHKMNKAMRYPIYKHLDSGTILVMNVDQIYWDFGRIMNELKNDDLAEHMIKYLTESSNNAVVYISKYKTHPIKIQIYADSTINDADLRSLDRATNHIETVLRPRNRKYGERFPNRALVVGESVMDLEKLEKLSDSAHKDLF